MSFAFEFRHWSLWKEVRFVVGVTLLGSIPLLFVPSYFLQARATRRPTDEKKGSLLHIANKQLYTAGPLMFRVGSLHLRYPQSMRSNQTEIVELSYTTATTTVSVPSDGTSYSEPERTPDTALEGDISIRIDSSAFDIAPGNEVSKGTGVPLPVNMTWMITPKAEGNHYLLVRFIRVWAMM